MKTSKKVATETNPTDPLAIITTGTGYFKAGFTGRIIDGGERTVFLGPDSNLKQTVIPEFTVHLDVSKNPVAHCQYGRDFVFADSATLNA